MSKEKDKGLPTGARNFGVLLSQIDHGGFLEELSEVNHQVNEDLAEYAKTHSKAKGTLTIVLSYEHDPEGKVLLKTELKTKTPKRTSATSVFWTTKDGTLLNRDPRQMELGLRDASGPSQATRDAIGEGGIGITRAV